MLTENSSNSRSISSSVTILEFEVNLLNFGAKSRRGRPRRTGTHKKMVLRNRHANHGTAWQYDGVRLSISRYRPGLRKEI